MWTLTLGSSHSTGGGRQYTRQIRVMLRAIKKHEAKVRGRERHRGRSGCDCVRRGDQGRLRRWWHLRENCSRQRNHKCKGPEVGVKLVWLEQVMSRKDGGV